MSRNIAARLDRLEQARAKRPRALDLETERDLYGDPAYDGAGTGPWRTYERVTGDGGPDTVSELTTVGPGGATTYRVVGVDIRDLV